MYFEDIFFRTIEFWKDYFFVERNDMSKTIFRINEEIDSKIDEDDSIPEKEAHKLMSWSISVVLGDYLEDNQDSTFNINSIPIKEFEGRFKHDLSDDSWVEEREKYKGFKDPLIEKEP